MELLRILEGIRSPFLDFLVGLITGLGEEEVILVIICVAFWCVNKMFAYRAGIVFFLSGITVQGAKITFRVDRPWVADQTFTPVQSAMERATGFSFPSGHTQAAASLFGSLGAQFRKVPLKIICFAIVFLVAFSRLYLGVHTLSDVVASVIITLLLVFVVFKFFGGETVCKKRVLCFSLFIIVYAVAAIIYATVLFNGDIIERAYMIDCLKASGAAMGFAAGMYIENVYIRFSVRARSILFQIIKFVLGFAGVMAIKEGLKPLIGDSPAADTVRYFLMTFWIIGLYPLIIKRFFAVEQTAKS